MKKVIAWLLVLALTAAVSIGATLAYLTDTDEDVNVMTLGKVKIDQLEYERIDDETANADAKVQEFHDNKPLYPAITEGSFDYTPGNTYVDWEQIGKDGYTSPIWDPTKINNEVDKMVFVKNKGDYDAYVRSVFAFEAGNYETLDDFNEMVHLNLNDTDWTWEWSASPVTIGQSSYFVAIATYNKILAPGALTEISLSQIALDKTATNEDVKAFGDTYQVLVKSQGIQADGFDDPVTALNAGFGEIDANHLPWENDDPTNGADLRTALHYLNGDTTTAAITKRITNIVFGKTVDHAATVAGYEGLLVDVEQDMPAYVYYVENGDKYDLYVLSDDKVYLPKDSHELFRYMQILETIDTSNLDVSRVENMYRMFQYCYKLREIDVSHWDVSNVRDFSLIFHNCKALTSIEVRNWDVSNGIYLNSFFSYCTNIQFEPDYFKNWDVSNAEKIGYFFYGNTKLEEIDLSAWDVRNVWHMGHMFTDCTKLRSVNFEGWTTVSLKTMDAMFNDCHSLKSVDMSMFDTSKCTEFSQVFENCYSLEKVIGIEKWVAPLGNDLSEMFRGCSSLKQLDLSGFDTRTSNKDYIAYTGADNWMFQNFLTGATRLEKITFGPHFSFDGDGTAPDKYKFKMPAATNVEGWDGYWYNAETGEKFLPADVPEETAATYVAVNPNP